MLKYHYKNLVKNTMATNKISKNLIKIVEEKYLKEEKKLNVGDIIKLAYLIPEGNKERTQLYEGVIICIKNKGLGKSMTIRKTVQGISLEQNFPIHSPKISSIIVKQSSIVRRAKLYFLRKLSGKASKLKRKAF